MNAIQNAESNGLMKWTLNGMKKHLDEMYVVDYTSKHDNHE